MKVELTGYVDGKKIQAVKAIRAETGLGLKESKEITDAIDQGATPVIEPRDLAGLDVGGVTYRVVPVAFDVAAFAEALERFPGDMTVRDLHATMRAAATLLEAGR